MKIIRDELFDNVETVELTRRNLNTLLTKLDNPQSVRTLEIDGVQVRAVEDIEHYHDRDPGVTTEELNDFWEGRVESPTKAGHPRMESFEEMLDYVNSAEGYENLSGGARIVYRKKKK